MLNKETGNSIVDESLASAAPLLQARQVATHERIILGRQLLSMIIPKIAFYEDRALRTVKNKILW